MTSIINYEEKANSYLKKAEEENNNKFARKSNVAALE